MNLDDTVLKRIGNNCPLERQKERLASIEYVEIGDLYNTRYDPVTQLHDRRITSGKTSNWEQALHGHEIMQIEVRAYDWLRAMKYGTRYTSEQLFKPLLQLQQEKAPRTRELEHVQNELRHVRMTHYAYFKRAQCE